jgi:hypothetical protein
MNLGSLKAAPKTTLLLGFAAILIAVVFVSFIFINLVFKKPSQSPPPTSLPSLPSSKGLPVVIEAVDPQSQTAFKGYYNIELGKTTDREIESLPNIVKKEVLPGKKISYELSSADSLRNSRVVTENSKAVFKSSVSITEQDFKTPKFSPYKQAYGNAEKAYIGSARYGRYITTYLYASKGFALIVNPLTDEVFEVQSFIPTSIEDYLANWGQDINAYRETPETNEY